MAEKFKPTKEMEEAVWNFIAEVISHNPQVIGKLTKKSKDNEVNN